MFVCVRESVCLAKGMLGQHEVMLLGSLLK